MPDTKLHSPIVVIHQDEDEDDVERARRTVLCSAETEERKGDNSSSRLPPICDNTQANLSRQKQDLIWI